MTEQDLHANYRCYLGAFTARASGAVPAPGGTVGSDAAQALGVQHANMLERPLDELRSIENMKKSGFTAYPLSLGAFKIELARLLDEGTHS